MSATHRRKPTRAAHKKYRPRGDSRSSAGFLTSKALELAELRVAPAIAAATLSLYNDMLTPKLANAKIRNIMHSAYGEKLQ